VRLWVVREIKGKVGWDLGGRGQGIEWNS